MRIGVLALQGDYEVHGRVLAGLGAEPVWVRKPEQTINLSGLILPGGESTTILKFLEQGDFLPTLRDLPAAGKPLFGTCAGAILLATEVTNPPQPGLGLLDMTVERNSYGRQLSSAVKQGETVPGGEPVEMVFVRAPRIRRTGGGVEVLARCEGEPVCVRQGLCLAATFHPELGGNPWLHEYFVEMVRSARSARLARLDCSDPTSETRPAVQRA